ncbi:MAG: manganese efflux pump [Enterocloster sp.]
MIPVFLFVIALCMDIFAAGLAYGANRVKITWGKAVLLNLICSGCLALALGMGTFLTAFIPGAITRLICVCGLFFLGLVKLLDCMVKSYINRHCRIEKSLRFSLSGLKVIVSIYGNPMAADADGSRSLSWRESVFLALAMSMDSMAAGTMGAFLRLSLPAVAFSSFAAGFVMTEAGLWAGSLLSRQKNVDPGWIGGVILILMAVMKGSTM